MRTLENVNTLAKLLAGYNQAFSYRGALSEVRQLWCLVAAQLASVLEKLKDQVISVETRLQTG
jgi:hypothetical protein